MKRQKRSGELSDREHLPEGDAAGLGAIIMTGQKGIPDQNASRMNTAEGLAARLAAIVESSDDAIISKDLNGIIMSWNKGAERVFGYTAAEAIGQPVTMLMPEDRIDEEPGILDRIRHGERVDHYETVRQRKNGERLHIPRSLETTSVALRASLGCEREMGVPGALRH